MRVFARPPIVAVREMIREQATTAAGGNAAAVVRAFGRFVRCLPSSRRWQLAGLLALMFLAALVEMISLGALVPFLALLADPGHALVRFPALVGWLRRVGVEPVDQLWALTFVFGAFSLAAAVVRMALNVATARVNFGIARELGWEIYRRALFRPYSRHVQQHTTDTVGAVLKVDVVAVALLATLIGLSSAIMAACIGVVILLVNAFVAVVTMVGFGGTYVVISRISHHRLMANGRAINIGSNARLKALHEGLGSIRDVLLDHSQAFHLRRFSGYDRELRLAQASNQIIGPAPRFLIEAIGMIVIAMLGYQAAARSGGVGSMLPTLGVLVLGAQRLLPTLQQVFVGWTLAVGHRDVFEEMAVLMHEPLPSLAQRASAIAPLQLRQSIELRELEFRYPDVPSLALSNVQCTIARGSRVGIVGSTGSGKSTLLNMLMGLLEPTSGVIVIDGHPLDDAIRESWQRSIGHVPQAIFLADATVSENVAFGIDRSLIDVDRVVLVLQQTRMLDTVRSMPQGLDTYVGEGGVRLSGGQRQRLGIARALYKNPAVLVLDEATSALDDATEAEVMRTIHELGADVTVFMIAHRLSTLQRCDMLLCVEQGIVGVVNDPSAIARRLRDKNEETA